MAANSLLDRIKAFIGIGESAPKLPAPTTLSKRYQRHEFTILQVLNPHLFKVRHAGKIEVLDLGDWRYFKHELANWCQTNRIYAKALEEGTVNIHCIGVQENLPRGIRFAWRFSKL